MTHEREILEYKIPKAVWMAARRALRLACEELGIKAKPSLRWLRGLRASRHQLGNYLPARNLITLDADLTPAEAFGVVGHEVAHAAGRDCHEADAFSERFSGALAMGCPEAHAWAKRSRGYTLDGLDRQTDRLGAQERAAQIRRRQLLELDRETERLRVNGLPNDQWRAHVRTYGLPR